MPNFTYDPKTIPQLTWKRLIFLYALPVGWWLIVMYIITPQLLPSITTLEGEINGYALNLITLSGYLFEFILAILVLRREQISFTWQDLKARLNIRWGNWKNWLQFLLVFTIAFGLTLPLTATTKLTAVAAPPPDWFPASQNPLKEVKGISDAMPGVVFEGNYLFLILFLFMAAMNVIGEDTYYRGVIIPKLNGLFGRWAWLAGGILFALKHIYVWWRIQEVIPLGIAGAFMFGPMGSLPFAMLAHFIGNYGLTLPFVFQSVFLSP